MWLPLAPASAVQCTLLPTPPQPMLSNPHSLGIQDAIMYEDGYRYDGRTMHRMVSRALAPNPVSVVKGVALPGQVRSGHLVVP